jgi:hypothetical protein
MREDKTDQELIAAHRDFFRTVHPDIRKMSLEEYLSKGKTLNKESTMFTKEKLEDIIVTVLCLAVFAGWGVLLALGV